MMPFSEAFLVKLKNDLTSRHYICVQLSEMRDYGMLIEVLGVPEGINCDTFVCGGI